VQDKSDEVSDVSSVQLALDDNPSPIVSLEIMPAQRAREPGSSWDVLMVHQDGTVRRVAGDLSTHLVTAKMAVSSEASTSPSTALGAHWLDSEEAKTSLLSQRPDLLTSMDDDPSFVALFSKESDPKAENSSFARYTLFAVPKSHPSASATAPDTTAPHEAVISHVLPSSGRWSRDQGVQFIFYSGSQQVSIASRFGAATYDLSTYTPTLTTEISLEHPDHESAMCLSPAITAVASKTALTFIDSKYSSIQAEMNIQASRLKRKRSGSTTLHELRLISYFPKLKRLLALQGQNLVAIDIMDSSSSLLLRQTKTPQSCLLIDTVGRGASSQKPSTQRASASANYEFGNPMKLPDINPDDWGSWRSELDAIHKTGKIQAFEEVMSKRLRHNLDPADVEKFDGLRLPRSSQCTSQVLLAYLISKIFSFRSDNSGQNELRIIFQPRRLLSWLGSIGLLSDETVEKSLHGNGYKITFKLNTGSIAHTLVAADTSCGLAHDYLSLAPRIPAATLLEAIKILLARTISLLQAEQSHRAIEAEGLRNDSNDNSTYSQPQARHGSSRDSQAALLRALERLGSFPSHQVLTELRQKADMSDLISLLQFLRQQLYRNGYSTSLQTQHLLTPPPSVNSSPKPTLNDELMSLLPLHVTVKLMSTCLDALGPLGLLSQVVNSEQLEQLIPDLKSEVALALEGMQEATRLEGLLREVTRYANSVPVDKNALALAKTGAQEIPLQQKPGTIVTLYKEPDPAQGDVDEKQELLPLSLRSDGHVSTKKAQIGTGHMEARSERDIKRLEDRNVGRYSVQRLLL
jgi:hypothetical protein